MSDTVNLKKAMQDKINNTSFTMSRRDKFYYRYQMYNDNYRDQVKRRLSQIYVGAVSLGLDKQMDLTNNIYKTIVEKISRVYSFGVTRNTEDETLEDLINNGMIDKAMRQANRYVNAFNDVLLQVTWNYTKDEPKLIFRLPHKTEVTLNEDGEVSEVEYFISRDDKFEKWAYWNNQEHYYKIYDNTGDFTIEYPENNDNGINPFGVLPFLVIQKGFRDGNFWDTYSGDDLGEITLDNSIYKTFKNYQIKWQSFKVVYATGSNIGALDGQALDPQKVLTVEGEDVSLGLLDLQANIKELDDVVNQNANLVAVNYNISPSQFRLSASPQSGFSLAMENRELDEVTIEQQNDFLGYEKQLFDLIVLAYDKLGNKKINNDVEIEFNHPTYSESRENQLSSYEKSIELGLKNPIEIIASERNIADDEAKIVYDENIAIRNKSYNKLESSTVTTNLPIDIEPE